jgi:glycine dehydrogenase
MVKTVGYESMDAFVNSTVPPKIRVSGSVNDATISPLSESELYLRAKELAAKNKKFKSYLGLGYHNAVVPPVILRNVSSLIHILLLLIGWQVMENPAWYTPYTPYQPEIAQGTRCLLFIVSLLTPLQVVSSPWLITKR